MDAETRHALEAAIRLALEATNGWACYAKRPAEHQEITRLHHGINSLRAAIAARPAAPPDLVALVREAQVAYHRSMAVGDAKTIGDWSDKLSALLAYPLPPEAPDGR